MSKVTRVAVSATPGGGRRVLLETGQTSVNTGPPVIEGVTAQQVLGSFVGTVSVSVPALAKGASSDQSFICALGSFPSPFTLQPNTSGLVVASANLVALPSDAGLLPSAIAISLTFGTGLPDAAGSSVWSLLPGQRYQGPIVNGSIRLYATAATAAVSLQVLVSACLLGIPSDA